jgi:hypothetical protein
MSPTSVRLISQCAVCVVWLWLGSALIRGDESAALSALARGIGESRILDGRATSEGGQQRVYVTGAVASLYDGSSLGFNGDTFERNRRMVERVRMNQGNDARFRIDNQSWKLAQMRSRTADQQWKMAEARWKISDQQWKTRQMQDRISNRHERQHLQLLRLKDPSLTRNAYLDMVGLRYEGREPQFMRNKTAQFARDAAGKTYDYGARLRTGFADRQFAVMKAAPRFPDPIYPRDWGRSRAIESAARTKWGPMIEGPRGALTKMGSARWWSGTGTVGSTALKMDSTWQNMKGYQTFVFRTFGQTSRGRLGHYQQSYTIRNNTMILK